MSYGFRSTLPRIFGYKPRLQRHVLNLTILLGTIRMLPTLSINLLLLSMYLMVVAYGEDVDPSFFYPTVITMRWIRLSVAGAITYLHMSSGYGDHKIR